MSDSFDPSCSPQRAAEEAARRSVSRLYGNRTEAFVNDFPAWDPTIRDFDVIAEVAVPASATPPWTVVAQFVMPKGCVGWGRWFGQDTAVAAAFQDVQWRIVVNGAVYILYPALAQIASLVTPTPIHVPINQGQTISVECQNSNVAARTCRARIKGVYHREQGEQM